MDKEIRPGSDILRQYDKVNNEYAELSQTDPSKQYLQYPEALRMVGEIKPGERVLDVGCGNGIFARMLARRGAEVVGYDPSVKQIEKAQQAEEEEKLGIHYYVGDSLAIRPEYKFDAAVSVMVLLYAQDKDTLRGIFSSAYEALKEDGSFSSITFNPGYKRLGQVAHNRRFSKVDEGQMTVKFINPEGTSTMKATFSEFSKADYEEAAKAAGFSSVSWEPLSISSEGLEKAGSEFWEGMENDPPYIGIRAVK